jgi:hypothetical protein
MNKEKELNIKWELAREVIHLAYDYSAGQPTQWDYISNLTDEDLESLKDYCDLQKYTRLKNIENNLDWNEINQLITMELNFRNND